VNSRQRQTRFQLLDNELPNLIDEEFASTHGTPFIPSDCECSSECSA
jgi:hypothetical protein